MPIGHHGERVTAGAATPIGRSMKPAALTAFVMLLAHAQPGPSLLLTHAAAATTNELWYWCACCSLTPLVNSLTASLFPAESTTTLPSRRLPSAAVESPHSGQTCRQRSASCVQKEAHASSGPDSTMARRFLQLHTPSAGLSSPPCGWTQYERQHRRTDGPAPCALCRVDVPHSMVRGELQRQEIGHGASARCAVAHFAEQLSSQAQ